MATQPSVVQMQEIVTKVRSSNTLKNASTNSALLQYLYEATLRGGNLKEDIINLEFYGRSDATEKGNPRVRVNVANLRKKLELYYSSEGEYDPWKVVINKGQYKVSFVKTSSGVRRVMTYNWSLILPYSAIIILIGVLLYIALPKPTPPIWRSVISKHSATNMYVGDMFGMRGTTPIGTQGWIRSFNINSYSDYNELIKERPELIDIMTPADFMYTPSMSVLAVQRMQQFFQERDRKFQIRFSSKSSTSDILESNAIYIGITGNDNSFIDMFNEANPYCKLSISRLEIKNHPSIENHSYKLNDPTESTELEYAIVSKYPAPNGTEHLVFFSRGEIGVTASVEYFTDTDSLKEFEKRYLKGHKYFTAVLKVKGQDRTNTSLKVDRVLLL